MRSAMGGLVAADCSQYPIKVPALRRSSRLPFKRAVDIIQVTGPLTPLADRRGVLVVADVENLTYGARDLGMMVDFSLLADRLRASIDKPALHAVFSAPAGDDRAAQLLTDMGWMPHQRQIIGRQANADVAIAFQAAALIAAMKAEACVIATGDGGLALDIAHGIRSAFKDCSLIATMSLAGSTSRLLDARRTNVIDLNIEIGRDAMRAPMRRSRTLAISSTPATHEVGRHA